MEALASQAAITLEALHLQLRLNISNTELRDLSEQLQGRVKELGLLYTAEREFAHCGDLKTLAKSALTIMSKVFPAPHLALAIFDKEQRGQSYLLETLNNDFSEGGVEPGDGLLGRIAGREHVVEVDSQSFEAHGLTGELGGALI